MKVEKKEEKLSLQKAMAQINKVYGEGTVVRGDQAKSLKITRVSWGIFALDVETGGGIPKGRIIQIHGPWSSGKTSITIKAATEFQKVSKKNILWIDAEGAFDKEWAEKLGLDMSRTLIVQPTDGPSGLDIAEELCKTGDISLLVVDSIANIVPNEEIDSSMENWQMGLHARLINKFIRKISMAIQATDLTKSNAERVTVILLNQERATMDKYRPVTMPGGMGKEFAASIMLGLRRGDWIADETGKRMVGHEIHFKVEKNKTYRPKTEGAFDFYVDSVDGIQAGQVDNEKSVVLYGVEKQFIERAGAIYRYKKNSFKGKEELLGYFKDHPAEVSEIGERLIGVIPKTTELLVPKKQFRLTIKKKETNGAS